jgi:hypothetical protein
MRCELAQGSSLEAGETSERTPRISDTLSIGVCSACKADPPSAVGAVKMLKIAEYNFQQKLIRDDINSVAAG